MIRKIFTLLMFVCFAATAALAQSTMTDEQAVEYIQTGLSAGKSQRTIMNELAVKGVNRTQAERVKKLLADKQKGIGEKDKNNLQQSRTYTVGSNYRRGTTYDSLSVQQDTLQQYIELPIDTLNQVFGRDIFRNKNLNFTPSENLATPKNYRLGPGDEVIIDVFGANQATFRNTITPDGDINVDILGPLYLSGMTIQEANTYLKKKLASIYAGLGNGGARTDIRLSLGQIRSIQINVLGDVYYPGTYTLSSFSTVFHALYKAGGIKDPGSLRNIKVVRNGHTVGTVDIYDFLINGNTRSDIRLDEGDVVLVPPYTSLVRVSGKVKRPMLFEMKEKENLKLLLNYAGGFAKSAYTNSVTVIRQNGKNYEVKTVDDIEFASFYVQDGDSVEVSELLSRYDNRVEIKGAVYRTGTYELSGKLNTVRSLIEKANGLLPEAFTNRAVLHRERPNRSLEVLQVDVKGILNGTKPDVVLANNDVLFIPSIYDLTDLGIITISGEVAMPGSFPYAENTTLEDLVIQAGGLLESASTARVDVTRRVKDTNTKVASSKIGEMYSFSLKDGFVIEGQPGFVLQPYDEVYVRRSPSYHEQVNVGITGEINFTGTYSLTDKSERLSSLVKKAGGVTNFAYVKGARLVRRINDAERTRMKDVLDMMEQGTDSINKKQLDFGEEYYVGINLDKALANPGGDEDVVLREGDRLEIPTYNNTVRISGAVLSPNTVTYLPNLRVKDYIAEAGGYSQKAKRSNTYIVHMNGHVSRVRRGTIIDPGSEIIVPTRQKSGFSLQNALGIASTTASIATMLATIANIIK